MKCQTEPAVFLSASGVDLLAVPPLARRLFEVPGYGLVRGDNVLWANLDRLFEFDWRGPAGGHVARDYGRDLEALPLCTAVSVRFRSDAGVTTVPGVVRYY